MAFAHGNHLLARLPAYDLAALSGHFKTVELEPGDVLALPGDDICTIYFPHSGIVSFVVKIPDGRMIQTGMVGRDGAIGAAQALNDKVSLNSIVVQMRCAAIVIDREPIRAAVQAKNSIGDLFAAHEQFFFADVQQTAVCNALHAVEQRACRWILRMADLAGRDLKLTQEQLAVMIGVTRPSVSIIATRLQSSGLISYSRGVIRVIDTNGLQQSACDCYEAVRQNYTRMFRSPCGRSR